MRFTPAQFESFAPRARGWIADGIKDQGPTILAEHGIDTPLRIAHFMSQIAHESAHFDTTEEYASGKAYEGRKDLGNTRRGDGKRFKGRGLIQTTGRYNYEKFTAWAQKRYPDAPDFVKNPEELRKFPWALLSAVMYWQTNNLNRYADKNDIKGLTRRINGGYNGLTDRKSYFQKAWRVWGDVKELENVTHGKPMHKSQTFAATMAKTGTGIASLAVATDQIEITKETLEGVLGEGFWLSQDMVFWAMLAVVLGLAGWIIYQRWRKSMDYSI